MDNIVSNTAKDILGLISQKEVLEYISNKLTDRSRIAEIDSSIENNRKEIHRLSEYLLDDLKKVPGWKVMMQRNYRKLYDADPYGFFKDIEVKCSNYHINFLKQFKTKEYVLSIDLIQSLEHQVNHKLKFYRKRNVFELEGIKREIWENVE